jgi:hypothetical protein
MDADQNLLKYDLQIDEQGQTHLKETAMWAKFIAIVGIILSVFLCFAAFFMGALLSRFSTNPYGRSGSAAALSAGFITVFYLIIAVVFFFISLYLYRFATKMKQALQTADQLSLNQSFQNIKVYFRILGIITVLYVGLIGLSILIGIIGVAIR